MPAASIIDIESLRARRFGSLSGEYTAKEVVLYALGLGCGVARDLRFVYECNEDFAVLPTFPVIAAHPSILCIPLAEYIPNCDVSRGLHGEQYIELLSELPASAKLVTTPYLIDIQDKGKGAAVVVRTVTTDTNTGRDLAINEFTSFILGAGGFGSNWSSPPRPAAATAPNTPPSRDPDCIVQEATTVDQATLYRLSGDLNPLHIDPEAAAAVGGYHTPILHGLCTMGVSVKLIMKAWGGGCPKSIKNMKVRFTKHVFPGETLQVRMWRTSPTTCVFQTHVMDRPGTVAISSAAVEFQPGKMTHTPVTDLSSRPLAPCKM